MKSRKQILQLAVTLGLIAVSHSAAYAGFSQGDAVTFNGHPVFKIAGAAEGLSAEHRAWQAQDALDNALFLSERCCPDSVSVEYRNGAYVLELDKRYITTADKASAIAEGLTSRELAYKWAQSLRQVLADTQETEHYIASLKSPNQLEGGVIATERRVYAPGGTLIPVAFNQDLNMSLTPGQSVSGKVLSNVPIGNYFIPANSCLLGTVVEKRPGQYQVQISSLQTPNGTQMPVNAILTNRLQAFDIAPHAVATIGMPANSLTNTRIPARIAIGSGNGTMTAMLIDQGSTIASGQSVNVVLEEVQAVAVVPNNDAM